MQNHPTSEESVPVRHLRLSALKTSEVGLITKVFGHGSFRNRITEMGFIRGKIVKVIKNAPLQDPVEYEIMGYRIALRHSEAELIEVMPISELPKLKLETDSLDDFKHHRSHHQHNRKRHSKGGTCSAANRRTTTATMQREQHIPLTNGRAQSAAAIR